MRTSINIHNRKRTGVRTVAMSNLFAAVCVFSSLLMMVMLPSTQAFSLAARPQPLPVASTTSAQPKKLQPTPVLVKAYQEHINKDGILSPKTLAAAGLASTVLLLSSLPADAAMSGGRMGGSFSRSSGGSMMRASPSYRGGGGGYSGGYGRSYSSPTVIAPIVTTPLYNPIVPYGAAGVGAVSYSRGPGLLDFLFLGGVGWFVVSAVTGMLSGSSSSTDQWGDGVATSSSALGTGTSVISLSVAVDVSNRDDPNSLLSVLDRLAATADTGTRKGVQNLTSQVAIELLRRKASISSASSRYEHLQDDRVAQRKFNQWSVQERSKFEQETVSKFGGVDTTSSQKRSSTEQSRATMAVVTLVLSIAGDSTKVPRIRSASDVQGALRKIAADVKVDDCLIGAEILWTPEDRNEVLSRQDVVADYPELISI